jgi:drug/metabolite transporter (DMT)-like permease
VDGRAPPRDPAPPVYALALALASALLFGASTPASKLLLDALSPFQLAGLLYLGAALGMAPLVAIERGRGARLVFDRANRLRLAGAVVLGGIVGPVLLLFALRLTLAGSVSLLLHLEMVATAVLGVVLFREHLGRSGWLGVAGVVVAGVLIGGGGGWPGLLAALLVAAACTCWGLDNHLTALIDGITPARSTLVKGAVAGATNLAIGLAADPFAAPPAAVAAALVVGALSYGASIALYIRSAHELGATRAQAVFASAPFLAAALSFVLLGEPLGLAHVAAAGLLLVSVALLSLGQHAHVHEHEAVEHVHGHRHDDGHHLHEHPGLPPWIRHSHAHRHERLVHSHPHWPDIHHRHPHGREHA